MKNILKKRYAMRRMKGQNDGKPYFVCFAGSYGHVDVCGEWLFKLFDIPETCKKIWVHVSMVKPDDKEKWTRSRFSYGFFGCHLKFWRKKVPLSHPTSCTLLNDHRVSDNLPFWFRIEYEA